MSWRAAVCGAIGGATAGVTAPYLLLLLGFALELRPGPTPLLGRIAEYFLWSYLATLGSPLVAVPGALVGAFVGLFLLGFVPTSKSERIAACVAVGAGVEVLAGFAFLAIVLLMASQGWFSSDGRESSTEVQPLWAAWFAWAAWAAVPMAASGALGGYGAARLFYCWIRLPPPAAVATLPE